MRPPYLNKSSERAPRFKMHLLEPGRLIRGLRNGSDVDIIVRTHMYGKYDMVRVRSKEKELTQYLHSGVEVQLKTTKGWVSICQTS